MQSPLEIAEGTGKTINSEVIDTPVPEKRYKIVLLSADESMFPKIERIVGTDITRYDRSLWHNSHYKNGMFPYTLYGDEVRLVESKAKELKEKMETIGAKVEIQRLYSSSVSDFRRGHIFAKNIELGKTKLQELFTRRYRKAYGENLDDWLEDDYVVLPFNLSDGVDAYIRYINRGITDDKKAEMIEEYRKMFVCPSDCNLSFIKNDLFVVNCIETSFDTMPCFEEMGIGDDVFYLNDVEDRDADDIERRLNDIIGSNNWVRVDNFLTSENMFAGRDEQLKAIYRCRQKDAVGNSLFMLLFVSSNKYFDGWHNCHVVFAINLIK